MSLDIALLKMKNVCIHKQSNGLKNSNKKVGGWGYEYLVAKLFLATSRHLQQKVIKILPVLWLNTGPCPFNSPKLQGSLSWICNLLKLFCIITV